MGSHSLSHYPHFPSANRKTRSPSRFFIAKFRSKCQNPCLEAQPTGLLLLVQSQCSTSQHDNTTISHVKKRDFCQIRDYGFFETQMPEQIPTEKKRATRRTRFVEISPRSEESPIGRWRVGIILKVAVETIWKRGI
ncbi:hypothetical protein TNCV_2854481 [Trichonephila clavipes]|nr:hypothetical protein TNCV_2854481 [Trichonephila clavipes]